MKGLEVQLLLVLQCATVIALRYYPAGTRVGSVLPRTGNLIPLFVSFCFHSLAHGRSRGSQRGTFRQYSSYSARNIRRSVGSSYPSTNKCTPSTARHATAIATKFARPNTTHSPAHPVKNPTYIGLRT